MPIIAVLLDGLLIICRSMVGRALLALGMGYVSFRGFDLTIAWLLTQIQADFAGMPPEVISFLGYLWVDKAISMIFSAYSVALSVKLAGQLNITKLMVKGG
jgi:hypothetical protein